MTTEQKINIYLQSLVESNEILSFSVTGIQEDSAFAIILVKYFEMSKYNSIFIYPYLETYKYYIIDNPEKRLLISNEQIQYNTVSNIESTIKDILVYLSESVPKNTNSTNYVTNKTNLNINLWKSVIQQNLGIVDEAIIDGLNNISVPDSELTATQITNKNTVLNWIYKLNSRFRIEKEVGDSYDLIADLSKRIALLERMLLRLFLHVTGDYTMIGEIVSRYSTYAMPIIEAADAGYTVDRIDLEDETTMITTLEQRRQTIAQIVKEEYLDKKL